MTSAVLLDILKRTVSVIEESDGADEHAELLGELRTLVADVDICNHATGEVRFAADRPLPSEWGAK